MIDSNNVRWKSEIVEHVFVLNESLLIHFFAKVIIDCDVNVVK